MFPTKVASSEHANPEQVIMAENAKGHAFVFLFRYLRCSVKAPHDELLATGVGAQGDFSTMQCCQSVNHLRMTSFLARMQVNELRQMQLSDF